ncbi:hypothetical protein BO71DRAFT_408801 [Aspergillus ellipticus CBS 707.79]|uniref:Uncharacterized protein n=1 Tax=Aspergillus ellipticus CBS 707.79 TaxID=1448320 RepID=A0A319DD35_9EURO|nr:hypothetical protein BO71DRAFT_408801 [Aspergillus ellipticus CBS 707.79]
MAPTPLSLATRQPCPLPVLCCAAAESRPPGANPPSGPIPDLTGWYVKVPGRSFGAQYCPASKKKDHDAFIRKILIEKLQDVEQNQQDNDFLTSELKSTETYPLIALIVKAFYWYLGRLPRRPSNLEKRRR